MKQWECKIYEVAPGAYAYVSPGTFAMNNPGLVFGDKCGLAIDSMTAEKETQEFYEACRAKCAAPVKYFVLTHCHSDHILGAHVYPEAVILAQENTAPILNKGHIPNQKYSPLDLTGARVPKPDLLFADHLTLDLGGKTAHIRHMGHCHSETDTIVYIPEDKVVYCGDLLYTYEIPDGSHCNVVKWLEALDAIYALDAECFVSGHGMLADREAFQKSRTLLQLIYDHTKACAEKGMHQVEAIRTLDLGEYEEYLETARRVTLIDSIYRSLTEPHYARPQWDVNQEMNRLRHERGDFEEHFVVPWEDNSEFSYKG